MGWYEYRLRRLNSIESPDNNFISGRSAFTIPFYIRNQNIFAKLSGNQILNLLINNSTLGYCIDEFSLNDFMTYLKGLFSHEPKTIYSTRYWAERFSNDTLKTKVKSELRYCAACFVEQTETHGFPWIRLSWLRDMKQCDIHHEPLRVPYCKHCDELLVKKTLFDSLITGNCKKCGNLLWSIEDKKPTLGKFKYSGDRRHIPFFVDASLDKLILDLCINLHAEVMIIMDSFTHDIELSDFQRFALHAKVRNCKTALEHVFKNDWSAFLDFFNGQVEVKWSKIKVVNQAYLPCKLLVAPGYEKSY
ncbi:hypothetical protein [Pseudidiomarina mangrovi]|uniref:hypothetical protein n=1 Tax=Pseudidiomarina mangrovi TaxID=2487133 RepID=UPI0013DECF16|nr:hypothetical protein [Pseudidiomarina mangrovi]